MRSESEQAASVIRERTGGASVDVGLVLGSGLAAIAEQIESRVTISYADLPGFITPLNNGHSAELVIGMLGTARVAVFKGRVYYYETGDVASMRVPLETLALLGAKAVVLTNAAGSTRQEINPGTLVAIRDHINLTGLNPLIGEPAETRNVDMSGAYDLVLRERFQAAARETGRKTGEGVYMWFPGPTFETPSEIAAARMLGADLVGMSTIPEVVIARQVGMRVLAVSIVTNYAAGLRDERINREQTMRVAAASINSLTRVLTKFCEIWLLDRSVKV
jgi:purine-nucleoside phosphorylase